MIRVYLDNCCFNRPFDEQGELGVIVETIAKLQVQALMKSGLNTCDVELGSRCLNILVQAVGPVDAERFIAYVNREKIDYTKWQQNLFAGQTIDEIAVQARNVGQKQCGPV